MEDIARNAELSKGTLYTYFSNKPSLFYAVVIKGMKLLRDSFNSAVEKEPTGLGKLKAIIQAYFDYIRVNADYYRLNVSARSNRFTRMLENRVTNSPNSVNTLVTSKNPGSRRDTARSVNGNILATSFDRSSL